jgi:hypothetical protein
MASAATNALELERLHLVERTLATEDTCDARAKIVICQVVQSIQQR